MHSAAVLPPTANTLSSRDRFALVRSSRKLTKVLGDVPRVPEGDIPVEAVPSTTLELTRTRTATSTSTVVSESAWRSRKPTHLPPLLKLSNPSVDSLPSTTSPVYHRPPPSHRTSVLSVVSNASDTANFPSDTSSERRAKLERLRRKLGNEVPATAVFTTPRTSTPSTPTTSTSSRHPATPHARTRSFVRPRTSRPVAVTGDDSRSVTFSINSDESTHTVTFAAARVQHTPPRSRQPKHVYQTGPLPPVPPVPPLPEHLASNAPRSNDDDVDAGLIRPRQKLAAGSRFGGADFKAARRAKREGRSMGEPGEFVEMVGFMF